MLRVLERNRSDLSAASFTTRSENQAACADNQRKPCEADGITPELSRPDLRRRTAADYQKPQTDAAKRGRLERTVMPQQVGQPSQPEYDGSRSLDSQSAQPSRSLVPRSGQSWPTRLQRGRGRCWGLTRYRVLVGREERQGPSGRRIERQRQRRAARTGIGRSDLTAASFNRRAKA